MSCGCAATVSANDIAPPKTEEMLREEQKKKEELNSGVWLFFPEGLIAICIVVGSPVWVVQLASSGHIGGAILLSLSVVLCSWGFWSFIRKGEKWMAYFCALGLVIVGVCVIN